MRVLHLVTSLDFGGLERRMEILAKYPSSQNELIFCALGSGGETYNKMCSLGVRPHLLHCDFKIFNINTFVTLLKFIKKSKVDVIHSHGAEANFYGMLAGSFLKVRVRIAEEIGIPNYSVKSKRFFSFVFRFAHSLIAMSPAVKTFLTRESVLSESKIDLVYNPVLLSTIHKECYLDSGSITFVFLGRLEKVKNPDGLLLAFNQLIKSGNSARLFFIGDGTLAESLQRYSSDNNLDQYVTFYGFLSDPFPILMNADVIVQPSHNEGFSLALVEAMSAGLPALSTPAGGSEALLGNGGGWIMKSSKGDDLYDGLITVLQNERMICEEGKRAIDAIGRKYDAEAYAQELDSYYASLISSKGL